MRYATLSRFALLALAPALLRAQATQPAPANAQTLQFDAAAVVPSSDSFTVYMGDQAIGYLLRKTTIEQGQIRFTQFTEAMGTSVTVELLMATSGQPLSVRTEGQAGGMPITINTSYANGRAKVDGSLPGPSGSQQLKHDVEVAAGTFDESSMPIAIAASPLRDGLKTSIRIFSPSSGKTVDLPMEVTRESLKLGAGTFDAYKVVLRAPKGETVMYFETAAGHRLIKVKPGNQPVEYEIAVR